MTVMSELAVGASGLRYSTIVADPPWPYRSVTALGSTRVHRPNSSGTPEAFASAAVRYPLMPLAEIKALGVPAAENAHLYLWATNSFISEAHEVARAWGFTPKTVLTWVKTRHDDPAKPSMKMGYYFRGSTEHVVFGVRGRLRLKSKVLPTAYLWPRVAQHSRKPDEFYALVEEASPGPYLEMFARRVRPGWDSWGNELLGTTPLVRAWKEEEKA